MTEKRYSLVYYADKGGAFIKNNETGTEWYHDSRSSLLEIVNELNELHEENTMLKEHQDINCQNCQYFVSDSASSDCLKREDIGYKGTCIDGMDLHKLAKNCPYY